jgi:transcription antitermination factor NusG
LAWKTVVLEKKAAPASCSGTMAFMETSAAKSGDRVSVMAGKYKDYSGVVTAIHGTQITVALIRLGRMTPPLEFAASELRRDPTP